MSSTTKKDQALGRPPGIRNPTVVEKILRDRDKMLEAVHRRALSGEPDAVRLCLELIPLNEVLKP